MIADGVLKGVHIKRGDPIDFLLNRYYMFILNAEIQSAYINVMPESKEKLDMTQEMIKTRYPYIDNSAEKKIDLMDKFNYALKMQKKLQELGDKRK